MKRIALIAAAVLCVSENACAQYVIGDIRYTCPIGASWNDPRCIREQMDNRASNAPILETRWGAISADFANGKLGSANNMSSESKARNAAIEQCKSNGGGDGCDKDSMTYFNQCGVIAWGDSFAASYRAATIDEASKHAIEICGRRTSNCEIYSAGCSLPERVR